MTSIERQSGQSVTEGDIETLRTEYKRAALTEAEEYTYAMKLAKEFGLTVTNEEIASEFNKHLSIGGTERSEAGFMKIIEENFGLTKDEYERMIYLTLLRAKVEMAIDENASQIASRVETLLAENNGNYSSVADALGDQIEYQETGGMVSNQNIDGGRAAEASKLEPGEQSGRFVSINGDGYYFVKLISKSDTEVNFVSIKVPFTEFNIRLAELRENGAVNEFIKTTDSE